VPSLSDKLKALGVQIGANELKPAPLTRHQSVTEHLGGGTRQTDFGEAYVIEERYPAGFQVGSAPLWWDSSLKMLAAWAGAPAITAMEHARFAFVDTETTGLSGGSGTFAFMVGIGKFEGDEFRLAQFFLREPGEEAAQLAAVERFLAGCEALVTFNGKSFDAPILETRFALHRQPSPLAGLAHLDLLHLARKLWRRRLPSRRLGDLETDILGAQRSLEDIPGYEAPILYREYLHTGDAAPLQGLFYHNAMDVLSMSALVTHISTLLDDPMRAVEHDLDLLSIGRLHEDLGHLAEAQALYTECLGRPLEERAWLDAAARLAQLYKRAGNQEAAVKLWEVCARRGDVRAHEELAKYFEHRMGDTTRAKAWTQAALERVEAKGFPLILRYQWQPQLEKRLARLGRKAGKNSA
jgi:hypothetical protein